MEVVLIGAGAVVALFGLIRARRAGPADRRRRAGRAEEMAAEVAAALQPSPARDPRQQALAVLRQPITFEPDGWEGLARMSPLRQFRLGTVFGFGLGLAAAGIVLAAAQGIGLPGGDLAAPADAGGEVAPETSLPPDLPPAGNPGNPPGGEEPAPDPTAGTDRPPAHPDLTTGNQSVAAPPEGGPATPTVPVTVQFQVRPGEYPYQVAARLHEQGLIPSRQAFLLRLQQRGLDTRLQQGTFRLHPGMDLDQIINVLTGQS